MRIKRNSGELNEGHPFILRNIECQLRIIFEDTAYAYVSNTYANVFQILFFFGYSENVSKNVSGISGVVLLISGCSLRFIVFRG